jgi:hypothetical protein
MTFYRAVNAGDRFRPRMLRVIVPTLRSLILAGITDRDRLFARVRAALVRPADYLPPHRLEGWLAADHCRSTYLPHGSVDRLSALRAGYVAEGMVITKDALDYAAAISR